MNCFQLNIVTAEKEIFSGHARKLFVTGHEGDLEVLFNHTPLLTSLAPGTVTFEDKDGNEDNIVIFGGMLEVQPKVTTILADSAVRAEDIDEAAALEAQETAEKSISRKEGELDYAKVRTELAIASAQLRLIRKMRKKT